MNATDGGGPRMKWKTYWTEYPKQFASNEYERQVKLTVKGMPFPSATIREAIDAICARLELGPADDLFDVCCGNGLLTRAFAERCRSVVGIDYSQTLIDIAKTAHAAGNITYHAMDALHLEPLSSDPSQRFSKVLLNAGLQYFQASQLRAVLAGLASVITETGTILVTAVPDRACLTRFYNTPVRRLRHVADRITGRDQMGTWWHASAVRSEAERMGFRCEFFRSKYHASVDYRFDVRLTRGRSGESRPSDA